LKIETEPASLSVCPFAQKKKKERKKEKI